MNSGNSTVTVTVVIRENRYNDDQLIDVSVTATSSFDSI